MTDKSFSDVPAVAVTEVADSRRASLLDAHREEFLAECKREGFTDAEAAQCLRDFEAEAR